MGVSTESDTGLSVSWTMRLYTDRPRIDNYDLQYRAGTSGSWTAGPQNVTGTSTRITGLESGTQYQVQILARKRRRRKPLVAVGLRRTNVTREQSALVFPDTPPNLSFDESVGNERKQVMDIGQPVTADDPGDTLTYSLEGADAGSFTTISSTRTDQDPVNGLRLRDQAFLRRGRGRRRTRTRSATPLP